MEKLNEKNSNEPLFQSKLEWGKNEMDLKFDTKFINQDNEIQKKYVGEILNEQETSAKGKQKIFAPKLKDVSKFSNTKISMNSKLVDGKNVLIKIEPNGLVFKDLFYTGDGESENKNSFIVSKNTLDKLTEIIENKYGITPNDYEILNFTLNTKTKNTPFKVSYVVQTKSLIYDLNKVPDSILKSATRTYIGENREAGKLLLDGKTPFNYYNGLLENENDNLKISNIVNINLKDISNVYTEFKVVPKNETFNFIQGNDENGQKIIMDLMNISITNIFVNLKLNVNTFYKNMVEMTDNLTKFVNDENFSMLDLKFDVFASEIYKESELVFLNGRVKSNLGKLYNAYKKCYFGILKLANFFKKTIYSAKRFNETIFKKIKSMCILHLMSIEKIININPGNQVLNVMVTQMETRLKKNLYFSNARTENFLKDKVKQIMDFINNSVATLKVGSKYRVGDEIIAKIKDLMSNFCVTVVDGKMHDDFFYIADVGNSLNVSANKISMENKRNEEIKRIKNIKIDDILSEFNSKYSLKDLDSDKIQIDIAKFLKIAPNLNIKESEDLIKRVATELIINRYLSVINKGVSTSVNKIKILTSSNAEKFKDSILALNSYLKTSDFKPSDDLLSNYIADFYSYFEKNSLFDKSGGNYSITLYLDEFLDVELAKLKKECEEWGYSLNFKSLKIMLVLYFYIVDIVARINQVVEGDTQLKLSDFNENQLTFIKKGVVSSHISPPLIPSDNSNEDEKKKYLNLKIINLRNHIFTSLKSKI